MREFNSLKSFALPTELRLILSCLRITPTGKEIRQIEELSRAKIAWPEFLALVDRHRVAPLVYTNLKRFAGNTVPSAIISELHSRFERNAHRSLANAAELVRLYKLFQENGIAFVPLKGSVLALQVYGNLARRHAGDIDLLVEPGQVELAERLLQINYRRVKPALQLSPSQRRRFLKLMHHFEYLHDLDNLRVELHWRAMNSRTPQGLELTRLLSRGPKVAVAGSKLPGLSLPDNILYLCGHGACHGWFRLFWLADLAEIMRGHPEIDWQHLMTLAREAGMLTPLAQGVILAHELLDVPLPEAIRTYALQERVVSCSAAVAYRFILCPQPEQPPISLRLDRHLCNLRGANSFEDKLKTLQAIFTGRDWLTIRLPDPLFFLFYLLRLPLLLQRRLAGSPKQIVPKKTRRQDD